MSEPVEPRLVICFRAVEGRGRSFLERARALVGRIAPLGADHVGFDPMAVSFAFEAGELATVLEAARSSGSDTEEGEPPWAVGIAFGDVYPVDDTGSPLLAGKVVWWGPALVDASLLAERAVPGELLVARNVPELASGALGTTGRRIGRSGTRLVRAARVDPRQPWAADRAQNLGRLREPSLATAHLPRVGVRAGTLTVLRADPGAGGTRFLRGLAAAASRSLVLQPSGSGLEPLGSLRRALARRTAGGTQPDGKLKELAPALDALLAGSGVRREDAAKLIGAVLGASPSGAPGVLVLDDAKAIDRATLGACVLAVQTTPSFGLVARLDAMGTVPPALSALPVAGEHELSRVDDAVAEAIAGSMTGDALDATARKRFARLGGGSPLAIVEAVACGVASGEILWDGAGAHAASARAGRGKPQRAEEWIRLRANDEPLASRAVLSTLAALGGDVTEELLARVFEQAAWRIDVGSTLGVLEQGRWVVRSSGGSLALPSYTHRDALLAALDDETKRRIHGAIAKAFGESGGVFERVEGAWHAARVAQPKRAAELLLDGARAAVAAGYETTATQLISVARETDPSCEEAALALLGGALESSGPGSASMRSHASAGPPPDFPSAPPSVMPGPNAPGTQIAARLSELAKEALLAADNAALERWVAGLHAVGESPMFTERMRALARLGRGDIGDALRVLRRTRAQLDPHDHRRRCQTSLALGVALSVAGRPQEALLEGMDALARAKQTSDAEGVKACLSFLAKLYTSVERVAEADRLRTAG